MDDSSNALKWDGRISLSTLIGLATLVTLICGGLYFLADTRAELVAVQTNLIEVKASVSGIRSDFAIATARIDRRIDNIKDHP